MEGGSGFGTLLLPTLFKGIVAKLAKPKVRSPNAELIHNPLRDSLMQ